jgi:cellulose synthase/poly-beta-1,6-N-acetylglucosamine synthase-like glycosyltransferase
MVLVSVFIPVYRDSGILSRVLGRLVNQDVCGEIFVVIDKPSKRSLRIVEEFRDRVSFILNRERVGKVNALNEAVKRSRGQILLFLDGDVEIPNDPYFLRKIVDEMVDTDFLDIKKEIVGSSLLSRMIYYEYIGLNIYSWLASKLTGKTPVFNGAAFAVRRNVFESLNGFRRVVSEDLDMTTRAFLKGYRFKYAEEVKVYNHVYLDLKKWIKQRRRWATGALLWIKEWCRDLAGAYIKHPKLLIPILTLILPVFTAFLSLLTPSQLIHELLIAALLFLTTRFNITSSTLLLIIPSIKFTGGLSTLLLGLLSTSLLYFTLSRKLKLKFKIHEFIIYNLLYIPAYILILAVCFIQIFILKKKPKLDWKV